MHDLIRAYAVSTCDRLPEPAVRAAQERVVDFYLHTAHTADQLLDSYRDPIRLDPPAPGSGPQPLPGQSAALAWLDTHHRHLLAAQHAAAAQLRHQVVWRLAWVLHTFHWRRGHRHDELAVWQVAARAGDHLSDPAALVRIHRRLGYAHAGLGRHRQAIEHLHQALALAEQHHDPAQQAHTHNTLGRMWARRGDHRRALEHAGRALDLYRVLDQPAWQALALNQVGWHTAQLGDYDTARNHCRAALALHREHRDLTGEATALDGLGLIEHCTGNHHEAIHHYRQALALRRALGNITEIAETLDRLGHSHSALDHREQARAAWRDALGLYRGHNRGADALRVQRQLDALGPTTRPPRF